MARRSAPDRLETPTTRLRLPPKKKVYSTSIAPHVQGQYRRLDGKNGSWTVRRSDVEWTQRLGWADDYADANGDAILSFNQMKAKALELAGVAPTDEEGRPAPVTVMGAVLLYQKYMERDGGGPTNASTLILHLTGTPLSSMVVPLTKKGDFQKWRDGLIAKGLKATTAVRYSNSLASALTLLASDDATITNAHAWKHGLRPTAADRQEAEEAEGEEIRESFILPQETTAAIVRACYAYADEPNLGVLMHVLRESGARQSQVERLKPRDLRDNATDKDSNPVPPFLLMPSSRKGNNHRKRRKTSYHEVPISLGLARVLRALAGTRKKGEPLLAKVYTASDHFRAAIAHLGLDPELTPYCLRYSSMAWHLLEKDEKPLVVAKMHNTSLAQIEQVYSRGLGKPLDKAGARSAMPEISEVVSLPKRA